MADIQIGIIGGTRGMGKWFADFLKKQGYPVHVSGRTAGMGLAEMAASCQVVVVSVPIGTTLEIIAQIGPLLPEEALLMDLTSVKVEPLKAMLHHTRAEVIGCHPLFGPQLTTAEQQHVVLCPGRAKKWYPWLKDLWTRGGALLVETTPDEHDELMSIVQGMNHCNTILMGLTLSKTSAPLAQLDRFTTPFFDMKAGMVKKIFSDNPRLYAEIICHNPKMKQMLDLYEKELAELKSHLAQGDAAGLTALLERAAQRLWPAGD